MDISHVDVVKEAIGSQAVEVLQAMFEIRKGEPPSVPVQRFRADHAEWINTLDVLEGRHSLIERSRECGEYLIRPYALPLIGSQASDEMLSLMKEIYEKLPELYREHLTQPLDIETLCGSVVDDKKLIDEALYYLSSSHGIYSGMTIGFPYVQNSTMCISESILSKETIGQVLSEYYEWHFVNPKNQINMFESFELSNVENKTVFFSENTSAGKPSWYDCLCDTQKALILEIDQSLGNNLEALPTIGLRTLLETVMVENIGDSGGFRTKVRRFILAGYVTPKMAEALNHVLDAGNASAHRAYCPSREDLLTCVELVKHLIHGIYIVRPRVDKVAENVPKRVKM